MRKSVLTGVLACALLFVVTAQKAEAAPIELLNKQGTEPYSMLVALANIEPETTVQDIEPEVTTEQPPEQTIHAVVKGESLTDIAQIYETTWERLFDKNIELENPDYIQVGMEVVIPTEEEVLEPREVVIPEPVQSAPAVSSASTSAAAPKASNNAVAKASSAPRGSSGGNRYTAGQCTWHVKNLRPDLPNNLGNARTWLSRASAQGLATGSTPRVGAVAQLKGRNHVAVVQSVNGDGTISISEMNFNGGTFQVNYRTVDSSRFSYIY